MEKYFAKCIGRVLQSLEVAGIENPHLKNQVKRYIWLLLDDINERRNESKVEEREEHSEQGPNH